MKSEKTRLPLTLIIGLGGTGCGIASKVREIAKRENSEINGKNEISENIKIVYFDTDANELRSKMEEDDAEDVFPIQTSKSKMTVGQALRINSEARENTFPISQQILSKPMTEGAGQIRAISKLAFDDTVRNGGLKPLHDAISSLQKLSGDKYEQSMRVVIVSTLVGGTGSGR